MHGARASEGRWGPCSLAAGLVLSFVRIGMFVGLIGFSVGIDGRFFRLVSSVMLIVVGLLLAVPLLQSRFAIVTGPMGNWVQNNFGSSFGKGSAGQFGIGVLLGAIWSPCVGPTLGSASLLAAQGHNLVQVAFTMLVFGLGVALPLTLIGLMSREFLMRWKVRMLNTGSTMKSALGILFILTGTLIVTGHDKQIEAAIVNGSPTWLTELTTRY